MAVTDSRDVIRFVLSWNSVFAFRVATCFRNGRFLRRQRRRRCVKVDIVTLLSLSKATKKPPSSFESAFDDDFDDDDEAVGVGAAAAFVFCSHRMFIPKLVRNTSIIRAFSSAMRATHLLRRRLFRSKMRNDYLQSKIDPRTRNVFLFLFCFTVFRSRGSRRFRWHRGRPKRRIVLWEETQKRTNSFCKYDVDVDEAELDDFEAMAGVLHNKIKIVASVQIETTDKRTRQPTLRQERWRCRRC
jgi:hypothetical protein